MSKKVAVLTDSVSTQFYFPIWYNYYSDQFGSNNIFVVTPDKNEGKFNKFNLGGVDYVSKFNNNLRIEKIKSRVDSLLERYDYVIRVDTDEFIIPNPVKFKSLSEYMDKLMLPYVTAYGFNIIPDINENALDLSAPILVKQRGIVYPYDALCKTCVVSRPTKWTPGFHFCSEVPKFDDLFLFHTKLADIDIQLAIGREVASFSDEDQFKDYHQPEKELLELRVGIYRQQPRISGMNNLYRREYIDNFLQNIVFTEECGGVYSGGVSWDMEYVVVEIPREFDGIF